MKKNEYLCTRKVCIALAPSYQSTETERLTLQKGRCSSFLYVCVLKRGGWQNDTDAKRDKHFY